MSIARRGPIVASSALAALLLAGCSTGTQSASVSLESCETDGVTLAVAAPPTAAAALEIAVATFEAEHPGLTVSTTELAGASYNEYAQQIIGDLAAGVQVDVANVGHDQVRLFVDSYDVRPFDTQLLHDSYDESFLPIGVVGADQYAIPFQVSIAGLYRNLDALAAAGIDTDEPLESLDDVIAQAQAYTTATGTPALGIDQGVGADDWYSQMLTQSLGGEFVEEGAPAFDSEAGVEAFTFWSSGSEGFMTRAAATDTIGGFVTGATPMLVISTAAVPLFTSQVADAFEWDMQAFPASSQARYAAGGNSWVAIADDDCRAALGQAFIAEVVGTDALLATLTGYGYLPVDEAARTTLMTDPATDARTVALYERDDIVMTPFGGWPGSTTPEVQRAIADMVDRIMAGADVADELASTQQQIEGIVGR